MQSCCADCCFGANRELGPLTLAPGYYMPYQIESRVKVKYINDSTSVEIRAPKTTDTTFQYGDSYGCEEFSKTEDRIIDFSNETDSFYLNCTLKGRNQDRLEMSVEYQNEIWMVGDFKIYPESDSVYLYNLYVNRDNAVSRWVIFDDKMRIKELHKTALSNSSRDTLSYKMLFTYE